MIPPGGAVLYVLLAQMIERKKKTQNTQSKHANTSIIEKAKG